MDTVETKLLKALEQYPSLRPVVKYNMAVTPCGHFFSLVNGDEVFPHRQDGAWVITAGYIEKTGNPAKIMCEAFHGPRPDKYFAFTIDRSKPITADNVEWRKAGTDNNGEPFWNVARQWWNNGIKNTRATECPGPEWVRGRILDSEHSRQVSKLAAKYSREKVYDHPEYGKVTVKQLMEITGFGFYKCKAILQSEPRKFKIIGRYVSEDGKRFNNLHEVGEHYGVNPSTARRWILSGKKGLHIER